MSATWTPGPWMTDGIRRQAWFDGNGKRREAGAIAVFAADGMSCVSVVVPGCLPAVGADDAARANARLIAAAPDLAEACRMLVESYDADAGTYALGKLYEAREAARAALSKARGETA